jgi:hypothetical protein
LLLSFFSSDVFSSAKESMVGAFSISSSLYTSTMGSGLASITWYGEDIMSIVTLGFVVAAISAADLLAEFLKLTLTMILSPDAKTSLSATDEELYNTISSAAGFCVTVLCCLLFFLAFFGLLPEMAVPALPSLSS